MDSSTFTLDLVFELLELAFFFVVVVVVVVAIFDFGGSFLYFISLFLLLSSCKSYSTIGFLFITRWGFSVELFFPFCLLRETLAKLYKFFFHSSSSIDVCSSILAIFSAIVKFLSNWLIIGCRGLYFVVLNVNGLVFLSANISPCWHFSNNWPIFNDSPNGIGVGLDGVTQSIETSFLNTWSISTSLKKAQDCGTSLIPNCSQNMALVHILLICNNSAALYLSVSLTKYRNSSWTVMANLASIPYFSIKYSIEIINKCK